MLKKIGPALAPLLLRMALGLTFIWAGLGKIEATFPVKGEQAALLANMGVEKVRSEATSGKTVVPGTGNTDQQPPARKKDTSPLPVGPESPALTPQPAAPATPKPQAPEPAFTPEDEPMGPPRPAEPRSNEPAKPTEQTEPTEQTKPADQHAPQEQPKPTASLASPLTLAQVTAPPSSPNAGQPTQTRIYTASEFPDDIQVPRVYSLAMLIHRAGHPGLTGDNQPLRNLWPTSLAEGRWPVILAWTVATCEVVGGLFVLAGLFTRLSAVILASTMIGAIWLTEVGPAIQTGKVVLGFIPDRDFFAIDVWKTLFWQLSLLMSALALALLGSGPIGLDRKLFPPPPPPPSNPKALI
ncbi:MAG TPA: DoxX family membrane protein [Phycisphaerales bacterium]|nr:DoxX family membrane protein [Phycisphaerales bacterium]